ncbi:MAG: 3-phosphoshikimate 1-carboxyvinyltransferase [Flavobacteriales bacterium]|nr:3-phosphoshikimate 1-carboxyvinyltransferase [Flavobacteriales bacterium]
MKKTIGKSNLEGTVTAPGSKSLMQRLIVASLLSRGTAIIHNPAANQDSFHALDCALILGAEVNEDKNNSLHIEGGKQAPEYELNVGESGLGMRLFAAVGAMSGYEVKLNGMGSLLERPLTEFEKVFPQLGAQINTTEGKLPALIQGPFTGGSAKLDGSLSSQFLSGLLMALPLAENDTVIEVDSLKSKPYVDMTLEVLDTFGIRTMHKDYQRFTIPGGQAYTPAEVTVEGDWSAGAALLVAGAVASKNGIFVDGLGQKFTQADQAITGALLFAGAKLMNQDGKYRIQAHKLRGFNFDATDCPDLFPALAALAVACDKPSKITGVHRLKHKESDRGVVIQSIFKEAGIRVDLEGDVMTVHPGEVQRCTIDSHNDHRIAMAGALLGLQGGPVTITNAEAVQKSYPEFWDDLEVLMG